MTQTRTMSAVESVANIAAGLALNIGANLLLWPMFGFDIRLHQAGIVAVVMTFLSFGRSYCLRRAFNGKET